MLQDRGFKVALVTDGRMSGASGKVPAAIHVTPEAAAAARSARCATATSSASTRPPAGSRSRSPTTSGPGRPHAEADLSAAHVGVGRELFSVFRGAVGSADEGAAIFQAL